MTTSAKWLVLMLTGSMSLGGCAVRFGGSTVNSPDRPINSSMVGGGKNIEFMAPSDGIIFLYNNNRLVQTKSMQRGELIKWLGTVTTTNHSTLSLQDNARLYFKPIGVRKCATPVEPAVVN